MDWRSIQLVSKAWQFWSNIQSILCNKHQLKSLFTFGPLCFDFIDQVVLTFGDIVKQIQNVFKQASSYPAQVAANKYFISNTQVQSMIHEVNIDTLTKFLLNKGWNIDIPSHYVCSTITGLTTEVTLGQSKLWLSISNYQHDCFSSCSCFTKVITYKSFTDIFSHINKSNNQWQIFFDGNINSSFWHYREMLAGINFGQSMPHNIYFHSGNHFIIFDYLFSFLSPDWGLLPNYLPMNHLTLFGKFFSQNTSKLEVYFPNFFVSAYSPIWIWTLSIRCLARTFYCFEGIGCFSCFSNIFMSGEQLFRFIQWNGKSQHRDRKLSTEKKT